MGLSTPASGIEHRYHTAANSAVKRGFARLREKKRQ